MQDGYGHEGRTERAAKAGFRSSTQAVERMILAATENPPQLPTTDELTALWVSLRAVARQAGGFHSRIAHSRRDEVQERIYSNHDLPALLRALRDQIHAMTSGGDARIEARAAARTIFLIIHERVVDASETTQEGLLAEVAN